jgi:hypothetical protein
MLLALNQENELVQPNETGQRAICPHCKELLKSHVGEYKVRHWSHFPNPNCATNNKEGKTQWHYKNQLFLKKLGYDIEKPVIKNGIYKIADVLVNNDIAIEFQHSSISHDEIRKRESHYKKVIWVFDAYEAFDDNRIGFTNTKYSWKFPRETILSCNQPVFLNVYDDCYLHILSIKKDRVLLEKWHTRTTLFYDGHCKAYNRHEFIELIKNVKNYFSSYMTLPNNFGELGDGYEISLPL